MGVATAGAELRAWLIGFSTSQARKFRVVAVAGPRQSGAPYPSPRPARFANASSSATGMARTSRDNCRASPARVTTAPGSGLIAANCS